MNKKYFFSFTMLLIFLITGTGWSGLALATGDVSIIHTVKSYVSDGPITTITLNLHVQNNSGSAINDITLKPAPIPNDLLFIVAENFEPLSLGNITVGGNTAGDYTITNNSALPEDMIESLPISWEARYLDDAGQEKSTIIFSGISTGGEGL